MSKDKTKNAEVEVTEVEVTEKVKETPVKKGEKKFSKEQLVNSTKFINKRDALSTLLEDNKKYTVEECETMLKQFYDKKLEVK